ncbi:MAG: hypothetical protein KDB27_28010, partial [Planctomycetales bacterium]|nr:hypothetical protein [Planctomycetales bacterium]
GDGNDYLDGGHHDFTHGGLGERDSVRDHVDGGSGYDTAVDYRIAWSFISEDSLFDIENKKLKWSW